MTKALLLQVLENNIFEMESRAREARGGESNAMEIDRPPPGPSHPSHEEEETAEAGASSTVEDGSGKAAKRVRFAVPDNEKAELSR